MSNTTLTQIPAGVSAFYDRNLLERADPELVHDKFGQSRPIPKKNSNSIKFRKYNALALATTPLTEGVTPTGKQLSITDSTATVAQYGDFVTLTDMVQLTVEDSVITEATDVLGEQAGQTLDVIYRDIINAGTNVYYAGAVAGRDNLTTGSKPSATDLDAVRKTLKKQNAKYFTKMIKGTTAVNTFPIRPAYWAIIDPELTPIYEALTGWKSVESYASQSEVMECEIGAYKNIRFIESTQAKSFGANAHATPVDVYSTLVIAQNAYGVVGLRGQRNIETIVKALGSGGTSDALNQRATVGWKALATAKILNDAWMMRLETSAV